MNDRLSLRLTMSEMVHCKGQLDAIGRFLEGFGEDAGVVDQDVQRQSATMKFIDESSNRVERSEIERKEFEVRSAGFLLQFLQQRQRLPFVSTGEDRVIVLRHQLLCGGPSEARAGARDDANLSSLLVHQLRERKWCDAMNSSKTSFSSHWFSPPSSSSDVLSLHNQRVSNKHNLEFR